MKLIPESSAFDVINTALNFNTLDGFVIGRLESYSCKMVGPEKALYKKFSNSEEAGIHDLQALSPPRCGYLATSPGGVLARSLPVPASASTSAPTTTNQSNTLMVPPTTPASGSMSDDGDVFAPYEEDKIVRKTLFYLVSTLNAAFYPDYDFSNSTSMEFSKEHSLQEVMSSVERQLHVVSRSELVPLSEQLWAAIDEAVHLSQCEIYTYNPDENSDPYSDDGCLWSFNYFFYNLRLKRIVFFTCRLVSASGSDTNNWDQYMDSDVDFD